jgi:hypothetical protein
VPTVDDPTRYSEILISLLHSSPYLAVEITGLVLALSRRDEDSKRFGLAAGGFALMLFASLISIATASLTTTMLQSGAEFDEIQVYYTLRWLVLAALQCCGWVLILMALFRRADRSPTPQHQIPAGTGAA